MSLAQAVFGFALLAAVLTVTPGLDTIFVLRQVLRGGPRPAFAAAAGIGLGVVFWGVAAAAGVAALFVASQVAYNALRWAGVAFLLYLAFSYLRSAWRGDSPPLEVAGTPIDKPGEAFVKGLLTDLLNPKIAVFYLSVLPLFLPAGYPPAAIGALLALIHGAMGMTWFTVVILAAGPMRRYLTSRRGGRIVDATAGVAMAGFAAVLGFER